MSSLKRYDLLFGVSYALEGKKAPLTDLERAIVVLLNLEVAHYNGGFDGYIFNSNGIHLRFLPKAFELIGAPRSAELAIRLNALIPDEAITQTGVHLDCIEGNKAQLHALDRELWDLWSAGEGIADLLEALITKDPDSFPAPEVGLEAQRQAHLKYCEEQGLNPPAEEIPLLIAAKSGALQAVKELLDEGVPIETSCTNGTTALYHAVKEKHLEVAELLLSRGASLRIHGRYGACVVDMTEKTELGQFVISHARNPDFCAVVRLGSFEQFESRLSAAAVHIREQNTEFTPLTLAVRRGHLEMCKRLIRCGADVNASDNKGRQPIHHVAGEVAIEQAKRIAFLQSKNEHVSIDVLPILELLLENGADVNATDEKGITPLMVASGRSCVEKVKLLLGLGAKPHAVDLRGCNAMNRVRDIEVARVLSDHKVNPNLQDRKRGKTLAHQLVEMPNVDLRLLEFLHSRGADFGLKNKRGETVTELIRKRGIVLGG